MERPVKHNGVMHQIVPIFTQYVFVPAFIAFMAFINYGQLHREPVKFFARLFWIYFGRAYGALSPLAQLSNDLHRPPCFKCNK